MVCSRCKLVVRAELEKLGLEPLVVELGEVEITGDISDRQKTKIADHLADFGFELIDDRRKVLADKIRNRIIALVQDPGEEMKYTLSSLLADEFNQDYHSLSSLFSATEGITIEQFYIAQKIERVKELLRYNELSISEIAYQTHYSSVAHLSAQFKKVTGMTPSQFRNLNENIRTPIEDL